MGVFEDAVVKAKAVADNAGKKASELVEIQKLKITMAQLETEIKNKLEALGTTTYHIYHDNKEVLPTIGVKVDEIDKLYAQVSVLQKKINTLKNIVTCPSCQASNDLGAVFCNQCGARMYDDSTQPAGEPQTEEQQAPSAADQDGTEEE